MKMMVLSVVCSLLRFALEMLSLILINDRDNFECIFIIAHWYPKTEEMSLFADVVFIIFNLLDKFSGMYLPFLLKDLTENVSREVSMLSSSGSTITTI